MKLFGKKILVFFGLLFVVQLITLSVLPYDYGNLGYAKKANYLKHHSKEFNTAVFGSSHMFRGVNAPLLDSLLEDKSVSTYNLAMSGTSNPEVYHLYENFLEGVKKGSLKTVLLELQPLNNISLENIYTTRRSYYNDLPKLIYAWKYIYASKFSFRKKLSFAKEYFQNFLYSFYNSEIYRYPIEWHEEKNKPLTSIQGFKSCNQALKEEGGSFIKRKERFQRKPELNRERIESAKKVREFKKLKFYNKPHLDYMRELIKKSKDKGVQLIFIVAPRMQANAYKQTVPLLKHLPKKNAIDLADYYHYKELYRRSNAFDESHPNEKGARILTHLLAGKLNEKLWFLRSSTTPWKIEKITGNAI